MLGAAYGDALGWPNERGTITRNSNEPVHTLIAWPRRTGGRFYPFEETIGAGEYSDDTQLILAVGRSRLVGKAWWDKFTKQELPFWIFYERGGGGATKRAANFWLAGHAPWSEKIPAENIKRYFQAGGNGVAMRILPHVLYSCNEARFELIAKDIFLDGITTHGHPRALVGALAYAYALWTSIRHEGRLGYGELIDELLGAMLVWSNQPNIATEHQDWVSSAEQYSPGYNKLWNSVVQETIESLRICRQELSKGVLASDDDILRQIHCFDRATSGSGTVAAAAAIYLASRYAPSPTSGVVKAAFAIGADTDTIASMTGGLLGVICGTSWMASNKDKIQDFKYLASLAQQLVSQEKENIQGMTSAHSYESWTEEAFKKINDDKIVSPLGGEMSVAVRPTIFSKSGKFKIERRRFISGPGQTFYLQIIKKGASPEPAPLEPQQKKPQEVRGGSKLIVESIYKSTWFYHNLIGLKTVKETQDFVVFEQGLVIVTQSYYSDLPTNLKVRAITYTQVLDIYACYKRAEKANVTIISKLAKWGNTSTRYFRCLDPDGNIVEVFSSKVF